MNVVITGASQGIGRGIAERFAEAGANLFLVARTMDKQIAWQQETMKKYPCTISSFNADLSNKEEVLSVGEAILEATERIDILVNNAGSFIPGSVHNEPEGNLEHMIATNLYSAYHLTRKLLPRMMEQKTGHIFNIVSIAALQAYPAGGSYSVSKYALEGFSKNLREEMKPYGIKVTSVHPGAVFTNAWEGFVERERIMEIKDVSDMVFAASSLSSTACVEDIILRPQLGDL
ncbi:MAG TPA: SDR family oxidoreductase [Chitinophagaceae bacterium]|nr:SDR family oxidoreductase [Chitinophagaceae bacterium]